MTAHQITEADYREAVKQAAAAVKLDADRTARLVDIGPRYGEFCYGDLTGPDWTECPANLAGYWTEDDPGDDVMFSWAVAFDRLMEARFGTSGPYSEGVNVEIVG